MRAEASVISSALQGGVTLVTDSIEADRCGILCLLVKSGLVAGYQVTLLSVELAASHYKGILKKLGTNVEKLNTGLHCIELLQHLDVWDPKASVKKLKDILSQSAASEAPKRIIVIDSLSCISSAVEDCMSDVMGIIRTAMGLASETVAVVLVAHKDVPEHASWIAYLEQSVDTVFALDALQVGKAASVNMQLDVMRPNRWGSAFESSTPSNGDVDVHEELFATVSERGIMVHHGVLE